MTRVVCLPHTVVSPKWRWGTGKRGEGRRQGLVSIHTGFTCLCARVERDPNVSGSKTLDGADFSLTRRPTHLAVSALFFLFVLRRFLIFSMICIHSCMRFIERVTRVHKTKNRT